MAALEEIATLAGTDDGDYEPLFNPALAPIPEYIRREGWSGLNPLGWNWSELPETGLVDDLAKWVLPGIFED